MCEGCRDKNVSRGSNNPLRTLPYRDFRNAKVGPQTFVRGFSCTSAFATFLSHRQPRLKMEKQALVPTFLPCSTFVVFDFVLCGRSICLTERGKHSCRRETGGQ